MDRIVVGVDGSPASFHALEWSADLAGRAGTELIVARAFVPSQSEFSPEQGTELRDQQQHDLDEWCSTLPSRPAGLTTLLIEGDPPDGLLKAAKDNDADLLVVGRRGSGGFTDLQLGSVAHHLTHHTTLPLAIVPSVGDTGISHVVIGVDGSPGSHTATELGAQLAAQIGVGVTVVYAFDPIAEWVPASDAGSWRRVAESEVRRWAAPVIEAGVPLDIDIDRDTHPVAAITRALEAHPGSVGVVGARGLGGFTGLRIGRVPLQLVHHTGIPVILAPAPQGRS